MGPVPDRGGSEAAATAATHHRGQGHLCLSHHLPRGGLCTGWDAALGPGGGGTGR